MPNKAFYVVGNPIVCTISERAFSESDLYRNYREFILAKEIMEAFSKDEIIKLFATKKDALEYARSLRQGYDPDIIEQPAIYKIETNQALKNQEVASEIFVINPGSANYKNSSYDQKTRESKISYYEIKNDDNIKKIEAEFNIHKSDKDEYHVAHKPFSCSDDKTLQELYIKEEQELASQQRHKFFKSMAVKACLITAGGVSSGGGLLCL